MGKKGNQKGGSNKLPKFSGGKRHQARARREILRLKMKIKRWEKYAAEGKKASKSRPKDWNTEGLQKALAFQERILKKPALRP